MTWHFQAEIVRKNIARDGGVTFIFRSTSHDLWYDGAQHDETFKSSKAHVYLYDLIAGTRALQNHMLKEEQVFLREMGNISTDSASWIYYWRNSNDVDAAIVLSDARLAQISDDLQRMLHGSGATASFVLDASFSMVEDNPHTRRPTRSGFSAGAVLLTEDNIQISFIAPDRPDESK